MKQPLEGIAPVIVLLVLIFPSLYTLLFCIKSLLPAGFYESGIVVPAAILTSVLVVFMGIQLNQMNYKKDKDYDDVKEQLKCLYGPLNAIIERNEIHLHFLKNRGQGSREGAVTYAVEYYKFFLQLHDVFLDNRVYGSWNLYEAFSMVKSIDEQEVQNALLYLGKEATESQLEEKIALELLNRGVREEDGLSLFEQSVEKIIQVITREMVQIAQDKKPVKMYFQRK